MILNVSQNYSMYGHSNDIFMLQLINTVATIKLIKTPQQINDHFDINNKAWKYFSGRFCNVSVTEPYIVFSGPLMLKLLIRI